VYTKCIINVLKEVFAVKRNNCDDIINQAEKVIADYISRRRNEIIDKYAKKNHKILNLVLIATGMGVLYFLYLLIR